MSLPTSAQQRWRLRKLHFLVAWEVLTTAPPERQGELLAMLTGHSATPALTNVYVVKVSYEDERVELYQKFKDLFDGGKTDFYVIITPESPPGRYIGMAPPARWEEINKRTAANGDG